MFLTQCNNHVALFLYNIFPVIMQWYVLFRCRTYTAVCLVLWNHIDILGDLYTLCPLSYYIIISIEGTGYVTSYLGLTTLWQLIIQCPSIYCFKLLCFENSKICLERWFKHQLKKILAMKREYLCHSYMTVNLHSRPLAYVYVL